VRVVSATHLAINGAGEARFRQDLFFRIRGFTLTLPALRERPNDLPVLLAAEIARAGERQEKTITGLDRSAADRLLAYAWPGNLRELSTVVHAAVALATGDVIAEEHLMLGASVPASVTPAPVKASPARRTLRDAIARHITQVLDDVGGNKRRAARELGVSRATLDRKLKEIGKSASR
jgi:two-component system response regulator HydG